MKVKKRTSKLWKLFPFNLTERTVVTFNNTLFTSSENLTISQDLMCHEAVHSERQKNFFGAIIWWCRYIVSAKFRLQEELIAYKRQMSFIESVVKDKNTQFIYRRRCY